MNSKIVLLAIAAHRQAKGVPGFKMLFPANRFWAWIACDIHNDLPLSLAYYE